MSVIPVRNQLVDEMISLIRETNECLQRESDLSPANMGVANIIRRLSRQLRSDYLPEEVQAVLCDEYMRMHQQNLQNILSRAEFLVELNDARYYGHLDNPISEMAANLPVWHTYMALVTKELEVLRRMNWREEGWAEKSPIVFVGSGPMPLSAIILQLFGDVNVLCVELDSAAYESSCLLLERMGLSSKVSVVRGEGAAFDYSSYNQIFVASLVHNKTAVLEQIRTTSTDPLVAVRTAEGMRQIMYEAIDEPRLDKQGWRIMARTRPDKNRVLNSTLFLKRTDEEYQLF